MPLIFYSRLRGCADLDHMIARTNRRITGHATIPGQGYVDRAATDWSLISRRGMRARDGRDTQVHWTGVDTRKKKRYATVVYYCSMQLLGCPVISSSYGSNKPQA